MPAKVYHYDLYGKRKDKYEFLKNNSVSTVDWTELKPDPKYHFFVPKDFGLQEEYEKGVNVGELFGEYNSGIQTKRDSLTIQFESKKLFEIQDDFLNLSSEEIRQKYKLPNDGRDWKIELAQKDLKNNSPKIVDILYRPFDIRKTVYTGKSKGFVAYPREKQNKYMLQNNLSLITCRNQDFKTLGLISNLISDMRFFSNPGSIGTDYFFPLYLYPDKHPPQPSFKGGSQNLQNDVFSLSREMPEGQRDVLKPKPNFNPEIIKQIEAELGMKFDWEAGIGVSYLETPKIKDVDPLEGVIFSATDLLDYIYAVLHSPSYREKYEEFLKIDFPRINFGVEKDRFWKLVVLGTKLRKLHLMESLNDLEISSKFGYPESGDNKVEKVEFKDGKVYVNTTQYFSNVPENVWNFYIGGYQPAQKWLKDRKGRELIPSEVMHYQKIVYVLGETERVMRLIDIE